jgi:transcriptional regulator with GAF, ATPase, and Fis domain
MEIMEDTMDRDLWAWMQRVAAGSPTDELAVELASLIVRHTGAERAFLLSIVRGHPQRAWGADLDGLALSDALDRVAEQTVQAALASPEPTYQPRVETSAGTGARVTTASVDGAVRAVLIIEHRFLPNRFDGLADGWLRKLSTLAGVVARLDARGADARGVSGSRASGTMPEGDEATTSLPFTRKARHFPTIVGGSDALGVALARLEGAIESDLPVLVHGETGVGKELFARALHEHGPRRAEPFVAVSCGAIPETLFEAELFGHTKGAFTGAERARVGLFAQAEGGTLFLDEIGELPLGRQAVLLRALESRAIRPVGGGVEKTFYVRVVVATNRDLSAAVLAGSFRRDLLYRINFL